MSTLSFQAARDLGCTRGFAPDTNALPIQGCVGHSRNPLLLTHTTPPFPSCSVLSARSKVFAAMFQCRMKEATESRVFVVDAPASAFAAAMHCLYTGSLHIPVDTSVDGRDIWNIADKVLPLARTSHSPSRPSILASISPICTPSVLLTSTTLTLRC